MVNKYWDLSELSYEITPIWPPISVPCYGVPTEAI